MRFWAMLVLVVAMAAALTAPGLWRSHQQRAALSARNAAWLAAHPRASRGQSLLVEPAFDPLEAHEASACRPPVDLEACDTARAALASRDRAQRRRDLGY